MLGPNISAFVDLWDKLRKLREQVKSISKENELESNSMARGRDDKTHQVVPKRVNPLAVLDGKLNAVKLGV